MTSAGRAVAAVPDLVFDLGAHAGEDTAYYLAAGYRVVAVEPVPERVADLEARFCTPLAEGRLVVVPAAIADRAGSVAFFVNLAHTGMSSLDPYRGKLGGGRRIEVEAVTLAQLFERHGVPHYLKIDIEGADPLALADLDITRRPDWLSTEGGGAETIRALALLGYRRFAFVDQRKVPENSGRWLIGPPRPMQYPFALGSSGPFGPDLAVRWLSEDEAAEEDRARRAAWIARLDATETVDEALALSRTGPWFDLHAGLEGP